MNRPRQKGGHSSKASVTPTRAPTLQDQFPRQSKRVAVVNSADIAAYREYARLCKSCAYLDAFLQLVTLLPWISEEEKSALEKLLNKMIDHMSESQMHGARSYP